MSLMRVCLGVETTQSIVSVLCQTTFLFLDRDINDPLMTTQAKSLFGLNISFSVMTSSVSFRITRTAEDLAQTITALSQRLVKLEQRQEALELQLRQQQQNLNAVPDVEISTLEGVEALLRETRELLESTSPMPEPEMAEESSQNHAWGQEAETEASRDVA